MPHFPSGNWQMELVYCSNIPNSSACYFYYILSTTTWFNANANYNCISVISGSEIRPATYKYTDVFPHISVPPRSAPALWYSQHILCFASIFSTATTSHLTLQMTLKLQSGALWKFSSNRSRGESKLVLNVQYYGHFKSFLEFSAQSSHHHYVYLPLTSGWSLL